MTDHASTCILTYTFPGRRVLIFRTLFQLPYPSTSSVNTSSSSSKRSIQLPPAPVLQIPPVKTSSSSHQGASSSSGHTCFHVTRVEKSGSIFLPRKRPCGKLPSKRDPTVPECEGSSEKVTSSTKGIPKKQQQRTQCQRVNRFSTMVYLRYCREDFSPHLRGDQSTHETCCQEIYSYAIMLCLVRIEQHTQKHGVFSSFFGDSKLNSEPFPSPSFIQNEHLTKKEAPPRPSLSTEEGQRRGRALNLTSKLTEYGQPPTS